jgi:alkaline phosphatase D
MAMTDTKRTSYPEMTRRTFVASTAVGATIASVPFLGAPAFAQSGRPLITHGVQTGDVTPTSGIIWSRADRASRMVVDVSTVESFANAKRITGPAALETTDFAAKIDLQGLPAGQDIFYRVQFIDLMDVKATSEPVIGRFRTGPAGNRDVSFVWSGDTAGQGWGINEDWGGMKIYKTMQDNDPDFFIHSGDTIYADNPMEAEVPLADGTVWKNVMIEEKAKVAETLPEFRGQYKYNLLDANVRAFNAQVPMLAQWDDHETVNNWYPNEVLTDERYSLQSVALLAARANRAFHEFMPTRQFATDPERIHRTIHYGPSLDIFFIDMRRYRADNSANDQPRKSDATTFLGDEQLRWLKQELLASNATWKVIASDMPIGLVVRDGKEAFENGANGDGPVLGREHDIADILAFIKFNDVKNVVWLTADVHYTAAHYYDPDKAQFQDFTPFWEFVSGPLNAGTFGPNDLDNTFGPQVMYQKAPEDGGRNLPPTDGMQFFGHVRIASDTGVMTVTLKDLEDTTLYSVDLTPEV